MAWEHVDSDYLYELLDSISDAKKSNLITDEEENKLNSFVIGTSLGSYAGTVFNKVLDFNARRITGIYGEQLNKFLNQAISQIVKEDINEYREPRSSFKAKLPKIF